MASKATAALSRLREIDKKYKSKQEKRYSIFSESSKSIDTKKSQKLLKPQLNIKMPDPYEEYINVNSSSESKKCSVPIKIICELPKRSSNSNDNNENIESIEEHEITSDKKTINDEYTSRKDETNKSISEILEDTQSLSEISTKLTKSQKSIDDKYHEHSSLNLLTRDETSKSDKKIKTEEEYEEEEVEEEEEIEDEEQEEKNEKVNLDLEDKNSLVHYSDESFESNSSKTDNSQSTVIPEQLQSEINHEKVSTTKELTILSKNETNTSDDIVSDCLNVSRDKFQESEEKLNPSTKNSKSFTTYNESTSTKQSSNESRSKTERIDNQDDDNETIRTTKRISSESEITPKYSNKQKIKSSESTSQVVVIFNRKSNKKKSKESDDTIETIKSSRQILSLSSSSSSSSTLSKSSQITKPKDLKKVDMNRRRKYVHHKPNERYCSSAMINYVKKMREEQQKLHMLPKQIICSDKMKIQSIKPLEFPKILNFIRNDSYKNSDLNLEILQNHLSNIRQWLKEQYLIYRENSEVAVHINRNYHPTTLNETKKIIYQLQSKAHAKNKNQ
ncbi:surfeit locus protein 6 homolog [Chelonus insularis]|uniref:surfeit locus protein 6 homolog n=1 Tax=Chelonus insularis TaxID=460826 RepID=UPI0015884614|nr:surfeit locus protein 6 homolog [Chelonus insularis]